MNEGENEFILGRVLSADSVNEKPMFVDWMHVDVRLTDRPPLMGHVGVRERVVTNNGCVFLVVPPIGAASDGLIHASSVLFWAKAEEELEEPQQGSELTKAIRAAYAKSFMNVCLNVYLNPKDQEFDKLIGRLANQPRTGRMMIHYMATGPSGGMGSLVGFPFLQILKETGVCGVHVIDCDFAGSLHSTYLKYLTEQKESGNKTDLFAFFACGERQVVPRSPGLPSDLFSSCLISPAKTALLWHSWHYFCFRQGALYPLAIDTLNNVPKHIITGIMDYLRRIVESMIMEFVVEKKMSELEFIELFRVDETISDLVVGFVLAVHIMDFFNVQPISIPYIPDVSKHVLWNSFELKLDATLLEIFQHSDQLPNFMEQELQTMELLMESKATMLCSLSHVNFLSLCLLDKSLADRANVLLCRLIDVDKNFARVFGMLPLLQVLITLLKRGTVTRELLLNLSRVAIQDPYGGELLSEELSEREIRALMKQAIDDLELWVYIFSTVCISLSRKCCRFFDEFIPQIIEGMKRAKGDIQLWAMLFLSQYDKLSGDQLESIFPLVNDPSPELRVAALACLITFVECCDSVEAQILERVFPCENDLCPAVRCQLVSLLSHIFARSRDNSEALCMVSDIVNLIARLTMDPFTIVSQMARKFGKVSAEGHDPKQKTEAIAWFFDSLLGPIGTADVSGTTISSLQRINLETYPGRCHDVPTLTYTEVKKGISFEMDVIISSNFTFSHNELLFGTQQGQIHTMTWGIVQRSTAYNVTNRPITHMQFLPNTSMPMLLACDETGNLFTLIKQNSGWAILNSFRITSDTTTRNVKFNCSPNNRKMIGYSSGERYVKLYDLEKEMLVGSITPRSGSVMSATLLNPVDNILAVCSGSTELYDTRAGTCDFVLNIETRRSVFDGGVVQMSPFLFAVCLEDASISYLDWRSQHPVNCVKPMPNIGPVQPLCFATHEASPACAVGHTKGATITDISGAERFEYPISSLFSKPVKPVHEICFHPYKFNLALTQTHTDIVSLIEV